MISKIRSFICYNQAELIKYESVISIKHKIFKENLYSIYDKNKDFAIQSISNQNKETLNKLYRELVLDAYDAFDTIMNENTKHIQSIFSVNGLQKPRVVIKTVQSEYVVDIFRSNKNGKLAYFKEDPILSNTGFSKIFYENEPFYLNDNLIDTFKDGTYSNPRITKTTNNTSNINKDNWSNLWSEFPDETIQSYISTLIIPMSISKDKKISGISEEEYAKKFFGERKAALWGFFCIDHPDSDFFKNVKKENNFNCDDLGYIIADILSLYLMFFYNHITGSETVKRYIATL